MNTEHFKVNGVEINYFDSKKGNQVVVLLHGLGSSYHDFDFVIPKLEQEFRVIALDARGHGKSTLITDDQNVTTMATDFYEVLVELKIKEATVVGFSMGGAIALQMAISYPELVKQLVLINSGPDFNKADESGVDILAERTALIEKHGFSHLAKSISNNMFPLENQQEFREGFEQRLISNDKNTYLKTFGQLMSWGLGEDVEKVDQRTLVIGSDMDYTPVEYKKYYTARMPNAEFVEIKNSRHGVTYDQPEELNKVILKFLKNE